MPTIKNERDSTRLKRKTLPDQNDDSVVYLKTKRHRINENRWTFQQNNNSLEHSFHLRKYDEYLKDASEYAMKGDRNMMEYCISEAIKFGRKAGIAQNLTAKEVSQIRKQGQGKEQSFHLRKYDEYLKMHQNMP